MSAIDPVTITDALAADLDRAFPDMVRLLQDGVFSGALRMLGDRHEAEEVAQEAFFRAYRALQGYDAPRIRELRLAGWVWTIAANLCRNRHRARARRPERPGLDGIDAGGTDPGPEELAVGGDQRTRLAGLLLELPWPQRSAIVLHYVVGLGHAEVATALGRPTGTIKSDIHRGVARLRSRLTEVTP